MLPESTDAWNDNVAAGKFSDGGSEVQDIISKRAPFILVWGTPFFFLFLLLIGAICWFISYPDIVVVPAKLISINAPRPVVCLSGGRLSGLNVSDDQVVQKGQILGLIESASNCTEDTLVAPISGKVAFVSLVQSNQQFQSNQILCYIKPENSQYFVQVEIPQNSFGGVRVGQEIQLKFASYPYREYGMVRGRVDFIAHIPLDSVYTGRVVLYNGLITSNGKRIPFDDGLRATGEIITQERRLLQRLFSPISQRQ